MKNVKMYSVVGAVLLILGTIGWLRLAPDAWEVQITGVTGDGAGVQYRIETVVAGTSESLIFRNDDAGFFPPYFKFDSADLQATASKVSRNCPGEVVKIHGFDVRASWFSMFPNATTIEAPDRCLLAPNN